MFKVQLQEIENRIEGVEADIKYNEERVKKAKEELRDLKVAHASLNKLQAKYEPIEEEEEICED